MGTLKDINLEGNTSLIYFGVPLFRALYILVIFLLHKHTHRHYFIVINFKSF